MVKEPPIKWQWRRITTLRGARSLAYLLDMSRSLRAARLERHSTRSLNQQFLKHNEKASRNYSRDLVDHLSMLSKTRGNHTALIVVDAEGERRFDYAALDRCARALAAELQTRFTRGDRALLLLDNNEHYVVSFFGCLYAGLIAVPVFPPQSTRAQHVSRLLAIAADSGARCVLTSTATLETMSNAPSVLGNLERLAVDAIDVAGADRWCRHEPSDTDIAFLQYTSGSTASPKGVMVSHANLMANERAIEEGLSIRPDDVFVSWLPLYHDMGLIGGLLQPIHRGIPAVLMSPAFFLERPLRWLEVISRYRGTISGGPDFAYRLCIERINESQINELDLSSWRVAFSGAEPVRHDTLESFIDHCAAAGFTRNVVYPCYGLAEATLFVTGGERSEGLVANAFAPKTLACGKPLPDKDGTVLVSCGFTPSGHCLEIVEPETLQRLPAGQIGEIVASGPSIAEGYWKRPQETAETFFEQDGQRWLRTGDLGFIHNDRLYITGRRKDLIILRGQNIYPQDIELAIEKELKVVRKGRVAAFSVDRGEAGESIGLAIEVSRNLRKLMGEDALVSALNKAVSAVCREPAVVILLLNPGALPKTSSGKLQRSACRQGWLDRTLDAYAICENGSFVVGSEESIPVSALQDEIEIALASIWQSVLKTAIGKNIGRESSFFAFGGNSLMAAQIASRIGDKWNIEFPARVLFERHQLAACANEIKRLSAAGRRKEKTVIAARPVACGSPPLPLSNAQQRQWFLWRLDPHSTAYHVSGGLRFSGALDVDALQAGFNGLIERHESLRTVFSITTSGVVEQVVQPPSAFSLQVIDLRDADSDDVTREAETMAHALRIAAEPFDLIRGPLLRAVLIRIKADESVLVVVLHHIVSDGASMQIFIDELATGYLAHLRKEKAALPRLPIQYADYAIWQSDWLKSSEGDRQLAYWSNQLGDEHPILALTTDHPRQTLANYRAARHSIDLPDDVLSGLKRLAESHGATLFMTLLAGLQIVLQRYTGQQDIRVGVPSANRNRMETEGLIGFFVNTHVLRNVFDGRTRLDTVLSQAKESIFGAQANQDFPFDRLVEALHPERSLSHSPLFQVMFNHRHEDFSTLARLPGITVDAYQLADQAAQFELTLETRELPNGHISASLIYADALFEPETIRKLGHHYLLVLRALVSRSAQTVGDVDLLDGGELAQMAIWSRSERRYPMDGLVHRLIERQAEASPQSTALIFGDVELSYGELNQRANRLAHYLIRLGIRPEMRVGLAVERSVDMVVSLLAVLKAGGAYVPLDPGYPAERLEFMMEDSGITLLLTQSSVRNYLPRFEKAVLELDRLYLSREAGSNPDIELDGSNLAYIIYTSGSTGKPKGVAVAHGPLAMHVQAVIDVYGMTPEDRELQFASINFDGAHERLLVPLSAGSVLVPRDNELWSVDKTAAEITRHGITIACFTPGYLHQLAERMGESGRKLPIRSYTVGGEAMSRASFEFVQATLQPPRIVNGYGPTETVVTPLIAKANADTHFEAAYMPIGKPVGERIAYVLDADLNRVPQGVAGELYIGGEGLARGYVNRAGLTSERFVADPFEGAGTRMYRTGDLVRWGANGEIEYLGRLDHQVKIRGFRIELGEIEAQLRMQPVIKDAVVVSNDERLIAYVVADDKRDASLETHLRTVLLRALPDYMIPSAIVVLAELPLNHNGKVNRAALPIPELMGGHSYEAPQGEAETVMAALWSEVLGVERIGRRDKFFDLGGHSLSAVRITALLAQRHGCDLPVRCFFEYPTLNAIAAQLPAAGFGRDKEKVTRLAEMDLFLNELEASGNDA